MTSKDHFPSRHSLDDDDLNLLRQQQEYFSKLELEKKASHKSTTDEALKIRYHRHLDESEKPKNEIEKKILLPMSERRAASVRHNKSLDESDLVPDEMSAHILHRMSKEESENIEKHKLLNESIQEEKVLKENPTLMAHKGLTESADSPWASEPTPMVNVLGTIKEKNLNVINFEFQSGEFSANSEQHALPSRFGQKSLFAREIELRKGSLVGGSAPKQPEKTGDAIVALKSEVAKENDEYLRTLTETEIIQQQKELLAKLDPKLIDYIRRRQTMAKCQENSKISSAEGGATSSEAELLSVDNESIKALEIINAPKSSQNMYDTSGDRDRPIRVAVDPLQYDLVDKCKQHLSRNRTAAVLRLFDILKAEHQHNEGHHHQYNLHSIRKTLVLDKTRSILTPHELCTIAATEMHRIRALYMRHKNDDKTDDDGATTILGTRHHAHTSTHFGDKMNAKDWHLIADVQPDVDAEWFTIPLKRHNQTVARQRNEEWCERALDDVTYCLLFIHLLLHARPEYTVACLPFAQIYAVLLRTYILGEKINSDALINCLVVTLFQEYVCAPLLCTATSVRHTLHAETPVDTGNMETLYGKALFEYGHGGGDSALYAQILLHPPMCCGSVKLVGMLFHPDHGDVVRTFTWKSDDELFIMPSKYSTSVTIDCSDVNILLHYACVIANAILTENRNPLFYHMIKDWICCSVKKNSQQFDAKILAALQRAS